MFITHFGINWCCCNYVVLVLGQQVWHIYLILQLLAGSKLAWLCWPHSYQHMVISAEKVLIGWFCSRKKLQLPRVVSEREVKSFSHLIIWGLRYVLYDSHSLRDFSGSISCDLFCIPKALTSLNNHHDLWLNGAVGHSIVPGKVLSWLFLQPKLFP